MHVASDALDWPDFCGRDDDRPQDKKNVLEDTGNLRSPRHVGASSQQARRGARHAARVASALGGWAAGGGDAALAYVERESGRVLDESHRGEIQQKGDGGVGHQQEGAHVANRMKVVVAHLRWAAAERA